MLKKKGMSPVVHSWAPHKVAALDKSALQWNYLFFRVTPESVSWLSAWMEAILNGWNHFQLSFQ